MPYFLSLSRQVHDTVSVAYASDPARMDEVATETIYDTSEDSSMFAVGPLPETAGMPLWCTCLGKSMLAKLPEHMLAEYIARTVLVPYSAKTITDLEKLKESMETIRREGIAFDDGEYMEGLRGVASGIDDGKGGIVGAVGVVGPEVYLTRERIESIAPAVRSCALAVTRVMSTDGLSRAGSVGRFALRELGPLELPRFR